MPDNLARWRTALREARGGAPVKVVVLGDSVWEVGPDGLAHGHGTYLDDDDQTVSWERTESAVDHLAAVFGAPVAKFHVDRAAAALDPDRN